MPEPILIYFARKPINLAEVETSANSPDNILCQVQVVETKSLSTDEYDMFTQSFLADREWLSGKGGFQNGLRKVIEVVAPDRTTLYIDPSGYSYARYVGLREITI